MAQGPKHEKKNSIKLFEKKIPFTPNGAESLSKNYQKKKAGRTTVKQFLNKLHLQCKCLTFDDHLQNLSLNQNQNLAFSSYTKFLC